MNTYNNNYNNQLSMLDLLNLLSLSIGLENYQMNLTQNDKQDLLQRLHNEGSVILAEIHKHLEEQDKKIDLILKKLTDYTG